MRVLRWDEFETSGLGAPRSAAMTIGVFDGVHKGHRALLDRILTAPNDLERTVITFRENPKSLLRPETYHGAIFTLEQKLECLEEEGIATCVLIDFSANFSRIAGVEFLSVLSRMGRVAYLAVGTDFRCGYHLSTDAEGVRTISASMGVRTDIVDPVLYNGHPISSSRIRRAVQEGRLPDAFAMLGRPYIIDLRNLESKRDTIGALYEGVGQVLPPLGDYEAEYLEESEWLRTSLRVLSEKSVVLGVPGTAIPKFLRFTKSL